MFHSFVVCQWDVQRCTQNNRPVESCTKAWSSLTLSLCKSAKTNVNGQRFPQGTTKEFVYRWNGWIRHKGYFAGAKRKSSLGFGPIISLQIWSTTTKNQCIEKSPWVACSAPFSRASKKGELFFSQFFVFFSLNKQVESIWQNNTQRGFNRRQKWPHKTRTLLLPLILGKIFPNLLNSVFLTLQCFSTHLSNNSSCTYRDGTSSIPFNVELISLTPAHFKTEFVGLPWGRVILFHVYSVRQMAREAIFLNDDRQSECASTAWSVRWHLQAINVTSRFAHLVFCPWRRNDIHKTWGPDHSCRPTD